MRFLALILTIHLSLFATSLEDLEEILLANNPTLKVVNYSIESSIAKEEGTLKMPYPVVKYSYFGESIETRTGPQLWTLGVSQKIPWPSKFSKERSVIEQKSQSLENSLESKKRYVIREFRNLWGEQYSLKQKTKITKDVQRLTTQWLERSRASYESGTLAFSSLIKIENKIAILNDNLRSFWVDEKQLDTRFSELFGKKVDLPNINSLEQLQYDTTTEIVEKHPLILASKNRKNAQAEYTEFEKRRFAPDLGVGFNYITIGEREQAGDESGKDAWAVSASLSLPLWFGNAKAGVESSKLEEQKIASEEQVIREFLFRVYLDANLALEDALKKEELYSNTIIPQIKQVIAVQESEYETGITSFINLFDSYEELLKLQLVVVDAQVERYKAEATLEWISK
jgi:cobalt-zinc-cadmium efflux system outer membrane protein